MKFTALLVLLVALAVTAAQGFQDPSGELKGLSCALCLGNTCIPKFQRIQVATCATCKTNRTSQVSPMTSSRERITSSLSSLRRTTTTGTAVEGTQTTETPVTMLEGMLTAKSCFLEGAFLGRGTGRDAVLEVVAASRAHGTGLAAALGVVVASLAHGTGRVAATGE